MTGDDHTASRPVVTVVIPCNDASYLSETLDSLAQQRDAPTFEVVVVDNTREDLRSLVRSWADRMSVRTIGPISGRQTAGTNRNAGAAAARGDLLVFVDADDTVDERYLAEISAALSSHELVAARIDRQLLNPWSKYPGHEQATGLITSEMSFLPFAGAGTLGIRADTFRKLHGFDGHLAALEEADLCWRARLDAGIEPVFVPGAVLHNRMTPGHVHRFRQALRWATYHPALYRRHREHGMPRPPVRDALRDWMRLVTDAAIALVQLRRPRPGLMWSAATRFGHVLGSLRHGVLYL